MSHIFISYNHKDRDSKYVEKLEKKLIEEGFSVWVDHRIDYGTRWTEVIEEAIDTCDAYIIVMSVNSKKSKWVQRERQHAERRNKPFFPLLLSGEWWFALGDIQYVDVTDGTLPPEKFYIRLAKVASRRKLKAQNSDRLTIGDIEFCRIQAGPFLMGSKDDNELAHFFEHPQHTLDLLTFYMARFPITNEQFLKYTDATGYVTLAENEGGWNREKNEFEKGYNWRTPLGRKDNIGKKPDHPVVQITWQDAMAYVRWLNEIAKGGLYAISLPAEAQWEKAARGEVGNEWPWGNEFDKARCNSFEGGKGATTPVDAYPSGASRYEVLDMVGNVWEWTHTLFKAYPYKASDGRESESESGSRVIRGGSFHRDRRSVRCACRGSNHPDVRSYNIGFRVCVTPA